MFLFFFLFLLFFLFSQFVHDSLFSPTVQFFPTPQPQCWVGINFSSRSHSSDATTKRECCPSKYSTIVSGKLFMNQELNETIIKNFLVTMCPFPLSSSLLISNHRTPLLKVSSFFLTPQPQMVVTATTMAPPCTTTPTLI